MLMAAGLGTRLKPFTELQPKALLPLLDIPMAQFALDALSRAGVEKVVANVHHHAEKSCTGLMALDCASSKLMISDESGLLLGSAGGLKKAAPLFEGEPFFVVNADVLCSVDLAALARCHRRLRARWNVDVTLTVFPSPPGGAYREILLDEERGLIRGAGQVREGAPFFVGAAVMEPSALDRVPDGPAEFVPTILQPAIDSGKAGYFLTDGLWFDIGSPALWLSTHEALINRMDTGHLPSFWRRRIESSNRRVADRIWVSKRAPRRINSSEWVGPCYWSPTDSSLAPRQLGPHSVLYGESGNSRIEKAIGYGAEIVTVG